LSTILIRRFSFTIVVLWLLTVITFVLSHIIPVDPAVLMAGPKAGPEVLDNIRRTYGLDRPIPQQYILYISRVVDGDLGMSLDSRRPVLADLKEYFPATVELVFVAMSLAIAGGISVGIVTAVHSGSLVDHISRLLSVTGLSVPAFWLGLLMQSVFYYRLGWLPFGERVTTGLAGFGHPTGLFTLDAIIAGRPDALIDTIKHLIMPAAVLSLEPLAVIARLTRASMLEVMLQEYIRTARAKGLTERMVVVTHALRNALLPTVTMIAMLLGWALGGSVLVEVIFNWPGVGRYAARSILSADHNAVMAITLLIGAVYLVANIAVDLVYVRLDPRMRHESLD
jgi:peptide/nickel transport system permease protein